MWPDPVTGRRSGVRGAMHRRLVLLQDQHGKQRDKESPSSGLKCRGIGGERQSRVLLRPLPLPTITGHWLKSAQGLEPERETRVPRATLLLPEPQTPAHKMRPLIPAATFRGCFVGQIRKGKTGALRGQRAMCPWTAKSRHMAPQAGAHRGVGTR